MGENKIVLYAVGDNKVDSDIETATIVKLDSPHLVVKQNEVSWAGINGAEKYVYKLKKDGVWKETTACKVTFASTELGEGENKVWVYAVGGNNANSDTEDTIVSKLVKPNLHQTKNAFTWSAVEGVEEYVYTLNGVTYTTKESTLTIAKGLFTSEKENTFTLFARGGNYVDSDVASVTVTKLATPQITVEKNKVSWGVIAGATGYYYTLNGGEKTYLTATQIEFALSDLEEINSFVLYATGGNTVDSEMAAETILKLATPKLSVDKNTVSWDENADADKYFYSLNGGAIKETKICSVTFASTELNDGENVVRIYAAGGNFANSDTERTIVSKFAKPVVTVRKNQVIITPIANAKYYCTLNGADFVEEQSTFTISLDDLNAGDNVLQVYADGTINSLRSDTETVVISRLAQPTLKLKDNRLECSCNGFVEKYIYTVNGGDEQESDVAILTIPDVNAEEDTIVTVYARGGNYADSPEKTIALRRLATPSVSVNKNVVTIGEVAHADGFYYSLDGEDAVFVTSHTLTFDANKFESGNTSILIYAVGVGYVDSEAVSRNITKLAAPELQLNQDTVSWLPIEGKTGYQYRFNGGDIVEYADTSVSFDTEKLPAGKYKISVRAVGSVIDSDWTEDFIVKLASPLPVFSVDRKRVEWTRIEGASYYVYWVGAENPVHGTTTACFLNLTNGDFQAEDNVFCIYAVGGKNVDSDIREVSVTKLATPTEVTVNANSISFDAVAHAQGYIYTVNGGEEHYSAASPITIDPTLLAFGNNSIVLRAVADLYMDSAAFTAEITVLTAPLLQKTALGATWAAVPYASGYRYELKNGSTTLAEGSTALLSVTFAATALKAGTNVLYVYATRDRAVESVAATVSFVKLQTPEISRDGYALIWSGVSGATSYIYGRYSGETSVDSGEILASAGDAARSYDLTGIAGNYELRVYAKAANYVDSDVATLSFTKLSKPTLSIEDGKIVWSTVTGATDYVYEMYSGETVVDSDTLQETERDLHVPTGVYELRMYVNAENCVDSDVATLSFTKLSEPTMFSLSEGKKIAWGAVTGATAYVYKVYLDETCVDSGEILASAGDDARCYDSSDLEYSVYHYELRVYAKAANRVYSDVATYEFAKLDEPTLSFSDEKTIVWAGVTDATSYAYELYSGEARVDSGVILASEGDEARRYDLSELDPGEYEFRVYAKASGCLDSNCGTQAINKLAAPNLTLSEENIVWDQIEGASAYIVYDGAQRFQITECTYHPAENGTIRVCAYNGVFGEIAEFAYEIE